MFLTYKTQENIEKISTQVEGLENIELNQNKLEILVELTEQEHKKFLKDKSTFIKINAKSTEMVSALSSTQIDNMDFVTIKTTLSQSNASDSKNCYRNLALDFEWADDLWLFWEDGMGISHSASSLGMTNVKNAGCYVKSLGRTFNSSVDYTTQGFKATFMCRNTKSAVTEDRYSIAYGRYGHSIINLGGINVSLSTSGVSIHSTGPGTVKQYI